MTAQSSRWMPIADVRRIEKATFKKAARRLEAIDQLGVGQSRMGVRRNWKGKKPSDRTEYVVAAIERNWGRSRHARSQRRHFADSG